MGEVIRKVNREGRFIGWYVRYVDSDESDERGRSETNTRRAGSGSRTQTTWRARSASSDHGR